MPIPSRKSWGDICLAVVCILYAGLLYVGSQDIGPAFFDLLGSAAVPIGCAFIILLLAVLLLVQICRKKQPAADNDAPAAGVPVRWDLAAGIVALAAGYVAVMNLGWLGFDLATAAFVFLAVLLLGGVHRTSLLIGLVLAGLLGFGGQYIFTELFFIDLPA